MKKKILILLLVLASLILMLLLPLGHDLWYHIYRIGAMARELEKFPWGLPIRMLSESYNGYGYGAALYYGDLFFYIPALLVCLGINEVTSYKVFTVLILWSTAGISFYSMKNMDRDEEDCLLFTLFYTFSSSCLLNLCIRSAIGESLAFTFLPLVVSSFYNILYKKIPARNWIGLGLSMCAIAMSHMTTLLLISVLLALWCMIEIKRVIRDKKIIEIIKGAVLMVGLSASFLFPLFEQMVFQKVQTPENNSYQKQAFLDYSLQWIDYLIPYEIKKIIVSVFSLSWDIEFWRPGTVGLFAIMIILFGVYLKPNLSKKQWLVTSISYLSLLSLGILPAMNIAKEIIAFVQFPWRILPLITIGLSFSALWVLEKGRKESIEKVKWGMIIGTIMIAGLAVGPRYGYQFMVQRNDYEYIRENNPEFYHKYLISYDKNAGDNLYLPSGVPLSMYIDRGEIVKADKENIIYQWERTEKGISIAIQENLNETCTLELPLYMYKGYIAQDKVGRKFPVMKSKNGLVSIEVGNYSGEIEVYYEGTRLQNLSNMITLITIMTFLYYILGKKRYQKIN